MSSVINEEFVNERIASELWDVRFGDELEGGNELFSIRPALVVERSGQPIAVYGVYNRETGVRETETRQYHAAKEWVKALKMAANGEIMPGLALEEDEEDEEQVH